MERAQALALLQKYNQEPFHIMHALTVEGVMRWYAQELGYGDDVDFWGLVGLLHDVDFEKYPDQHCKKAPELLKEIDADDAFIHAVVCHGYGIKQGAETLGWDLNDLFEKTILAMRSCEDGVRKECLELTGVEE